MEFSVTIYRSTRVRGPEYGKRSTVRRSKNLAILLREMVRYTGKDHSTIETPTSSLVATLHRFYAFLVPCP